MANSTDTERARIQQETMAQLRRARAEIDPALLQKARDAIGNPDEEKVSRSHMLEAVKGYLLLKRGNKSITQNLAKLLAKDQ
jgi:23S rRNA maturation mini-RNase III